MSSDLNRRGFLSATAAVAVLGLADETRAEEAAGGGGQARKIKIVGVSCSPRKGKTTAAGLQIALAAAKEVAPNVETELVELAGMKIDGNLAAGVQAEPGVEDDFGKLVPVLSDAQVGGIIIGTPVYFSGMSSLCKAFLERCMVFRKNNFALSNRVGGVLAVGGARNGGQETTIQSVQAALMCQEMVVVGDGRPTAHTGATLFNPGNDDVSGDQFGLSTAKNLGRRVAEVAIRLAGAR